MSPVVFIEVLLTKFEELELDLCLPFFETLGDNFLFFGKFLNLCLPKFYLILLIDELQSFLLK
jgi:hypothetical protein